jgi:hypothetical protein
VGSLVVGGLSDLGPVGFACRCAFSGEVGMVLTYQAGREGSCCDGSFGADGGHEL